MPDAAQTRFAAANSALSRGDGIAAEAELHRALLAGASQPELAAAMGEALIDQSAFDQDRTWLAPVQFAPSEAARGWRMLGTLERLSGNLAQAGMAHDRALLIAPNEPLLWVEIGRMRYSGGEHLQAARGLLDRIPHRPDAPASQMLLQGLLDLEAGNANLAADELGILADRQPANQRVQLLLARALYVAGDYDQLFTRFAGLAQRTDASPYLLTLLGRAYEDQGNRVAAAPLLDRAATLAPPALGSIFEPDSPGTLAPSFAAAPAAAGQAAHYVRSLLNAHNHTSAWQAANRFLQLRPGSSEALALMGDVELVSGRPNDALAHYQRSALVRFPDLLLLLRMCEAYDYFGQASAAEPVVGEYLAAFPNSRLAARVMAHRAELGSDWPTAVRLLAGLRTRGGNRDVRLLTDLSQAQRRSGDTPAALASAQRAWDCSPVTRTRRRPWVAHWLRLAQMPPARTS